MGTRQGEGEREGEGEWLSVLVSESVLLLLATVRV